MQGRENTEPGLLFLGINRKSEKGLHEFMKKLTNVSQRQLNSQVIASTHSSIMTGLPFSSPSSSPCSEIEASI